MPSSSQSRATFVSGLPMAAAARRTFAAVIFGLRPPFRPRARADASPARVRSEIRSRSNSASDAKIPKTSLPEGVVVSIEAPCPVRTRKPMFCNLRSWTTLTRWRRLRPSPVELPNNERVTVAQRLETRLKAGAIVELAARSVAIEIAFRDAGGNERVMLQVEDL